MNILGLYKIGQDLYNVLPSQTLFTVLFINKYQSIEGVSGIHLMGYKQEKEIASVISNFK